jgi:chromosome segregation protein
MYLKELTINGFKSFAKKSDFEFSAPITAIVGPNGSGKSNVAESFRFVLGEQSVKSMRGKRGEDLIWGGSDKTTRGNRAAVELIFDNSKRTFTLDFDEVKIERIVHRDGANEYKLNGSQVRLKDIHELLASANIGSTGHHIISQGEADRILSAGPKERREMIEDALGLKNHREYCPGALFASRSCTPFKIFKEAGREGRAVT